MEREDIVALTTAVRAFKDALGRLKRIFHPDRGELRLVGGRSGVSEWGEAVLMV